jgi:hypothetical protein
MKKFTNEELQNIKANCKSLYKKGGGLDGSVKFNKVWYDTIIALCNQAKQPKLKI